MFKRNESIIADTTIVVPQYSSVSMEEEFQHVQRWSDINKLQINITKTK